MDITNLLYHTQVYLVTTNVVAGDIYPIIGHSWGLYGDWINRKDLAPPDGIRFFEISQGAATPRIDDTTHGIRASDGAVVPMPLVSVIGGTVADGEVHVELLADGEEHLLVAGLPSGAWVKRVVDAETGGGPMAVLDAAEDLTVRAHFPGQALVWVYPHDGRARTAIHVEFV